MLIVTGVELTSSGVTVDARAVAELKLKPTGSGTVHSFAMPPARAFSEVVAAIISRTHRPGAHAGTLAASSSFAVLAIIIAPQDRHALLGFGQPNKHIRLAEGQNIGGWTVEAILPDEVIVRHADVREDFKAKDRAGTAGAVAAPSAATVMPGSSQKPPPQHRARDE
jgi:hypothetical protein